MLALLWMIYLMVVSAMMFSSLSGARVISSSVSRPASQEALVLIMCGVALLWPALRLCQAVPLTGIVNASLRDAVVIVIPLTAVLWPHRLIVLGGWTNEVLLALTAHGAAWVVLVSGAIALSLVCVSVSRRPALVRSVAAALIVICVLGVPVIELVSEVGVRMDERSAHLGWMLSPVTGVLEITRDRSVLGPAAQVSGTHFQIIGGVACLGVALHFAALALHRAVPLVGRSGAPYA